MFLSFRYLQTISSSFFSYKVPYWQHFSLVLHAVLVYRGTQFAVCYLKGLWLWLFQSLLQVHRICLCNLFIQAGGSGLLACEFTHPPVFQLYSCGWPFYIGAADAVTQFPWDPFHYYRCAILTGFCPYLGMFSYFSTNYNMVDFLPSLIDNSVQRAVVLVLSMVIYAIYSLTCFYYGRWGRAMSCVPLVWPYCCSQAAFFIQGLARMPTRQKPGS